MPLFKAPYLFRKTSPTNDTPDTPDPLTEALEKVAKKYTENHPKSKSIHERAVKCLPGGNTRTLLHTSPFPLSIKSGRDWYVYDEDEHCYTDFVGEMTAGLYGHSRPELRGAILRVLDDIGMTLGGTTKAEAKYARLLCQRFNLDRVRFANSGTEANLHALYAAKRFTKRRRIVVFTGAYHGGVLCFVDGTVSPNTVDRDDWVMARYNDIDSARHAIEGTPDIAAVFIEAMQGSSGAIVGEHNFLHAVAASAKKVGALLILDEVQTSRLAPAGIKSTIEGFNPDLITMGKWLGGGFAIGVFGGRADVMSVYDPRNGSASLAHSGTFNNNTMAMTAGYTGLKHVFTPEVVGPFNKMGDDLRIKLNTVARGTKCSFTGLGSILCAHFTDSGTEHLRRAGQVAERRDLGDLFWFEMLQRGFWVSRKGSIGLILGTPQEELSRFVTAVAEFLDKYKGLVDVTE